VAVLFGLGSAIFLLGAVIGYGRGGFGDGGTSARGFEWAVKTGCLLLAVSVTVGVCGGSLMSRLKLPAFLGWAGVMGLTFAFMNGGGVLLGMNAHGFWPEVLKGLALGATVGAISGPLFQRIQARNIRASQRPNAPAVDP
jgi:hypothetical protein